MALPPLSQKLTQEEIDKAVAFADWLQSSVNSKNPSTTELDAWNLFRYVCELKVELAEQRRLFELGEAWDGKP